jgi:septal ring factor EnvC (AmiA/AmiB activator)
MPTIDWGSLPGWIALGVVLISIITGLLKAPSEGANLSSQTITNLNKAIKDSTDQNQELRGQMKTQDGEISDLTARVKTLEKADADKEGKIYELTNGIRKLIKQFERLNIKPDWTPNGIEFETPTEKRMTGGRMT